MDAGVQTPGRGEWTGCLPGVGGTLKVAMGPQPAEGERPRMEAGRELPSRRPLGLPMWHRSPPALAWHAALALCLGAQQGAAAEGRAGVLPVRPVIRPLPWGGRAPSRPLLQLSSVPGVVFGPLGLLLVGLVVVLSRICALDRFRQLGKGVDERLGGCPVRLRRGPTWLPWKTPEFPVEEGETRAPCSPEPDGGTGRVKLEKEVGEGSGVVQTPVGSSLDLRGQPLMYRRDRQLVVLNRACEGKCSIFHGVDII